MKTCNECGETKVVDEFYFHHGRRVARCKSCYQRKTKLWNAEHKTADRVSRWEANRKAKKQRIKDAVFGAYGGYVCACCGETERSFLTIDHVWNDGADWRRGTLGSRLATGWHTYQWLFKNGFPGGFQVLCMNCNFGKRMNGGKCPHSARCNDHPLVGVGPSGPKRMAPENVSGGDMVSSTMKVVAVRLA
jgi:hypothetical protein